MSSSTQHYLGVLALITALSAFIMSTLAYRVIFWLALAVGWLATIFLAIYVVGILTKGILGAKLRGQLQGFALVSASTLLTLVVAEACFAVLETPGFFIDAYKNNPRYEDNEPFLLPGMLSEDAIDSMAQRRGVVSLPDEWRKTRAVVDGAYQAYRWHDVVHVYDQNRFRRVTPFPPKQAGKFRIVVVGDSLTYGEGIANKFTYSALLQKYFDNSEVEVLNLGVPGNQSEDTVEVALEFLPQLQADLLVYGVCLNDFLPSGVGEYQEDDFTFPLPAEFKAHFVKHSRLARLVSQGYDKLLIQTGLREDFMDDILSDFDGYQMRFKRDVETLAAVAAESSDDIHLIAMVLNQFPETGGRSQEISVIAEQHLREAGFTVMDSASYAEVFDGEFMTVSPWEGHPNELANAIFASRLVPGVVDKLMQSSR